MTAYARPRPLAPDDRTEEFRCRAAELDEWLDRHARTAAAVGSARTFGTVSADRVAGYYALAAGSVERSAAAGRLGRGMPAMPSRSWCRRGWASTSATREREWGGACYATPCCGR